MPTLSPTDMHASDTSQPSPLEAPGAASSSDAISTASGPNWSPTPSEIAIHKAPADPVEKHKETRRGKNGKADQRPRGRFRDLVFTRNFSAFDRMNEAAANSPFHGFFTLSWLALSLFMLKTAGENWRVHGSPLGTNDIMKETFSRDGKQCHLATVASSLAPLLRDLYGLLV